MIPTNAFYMLSGYVALVAYIAAFCVYNTVALSHDVIRTIIALCGLVIISTMIMLYKNGFTKCIAFYESTFGLHNLAFVILLDFMTHWLPVLLLVFACINNLDIELISVECMLMAYCLFLVYYIAMRDRLVTIYGGLVDPDAWTDSCVLFVGLVVIIGVACITLV